MRLPLSNSRKERGFTLVELMIAMVAGALVLGAVMTSFLSQHRNYLAQDDVVEMQQNGRVAIDMLTRDIRMAGFDPTEDANATITDAQPGQFSFTQDITDNAGTGDSDGDVDDSGEEIDLGFGTGNDAGRDGIPDADADGDGVPDAASLGRQTGGAGGYQPIAENIQAIEFLYTIGDGAAAPTTTPPAAQYDNISAVQISILARASNPDQNFTNSMTYTTPSGATWGPFADNFRRRLFITTIKLRNL